MGSVCPAWELTTGLPSGEIPDSDKSDKTSERANNSLTTEQFWFNRSKATQGSW